jgi:hypothetical protein
MTSLNSLAADILVSQSNTLQSLAETLLSQNNTSNSMTPPDPSVSLTRQSLTIPTGSSYQSTLTNQCSDLGYAGVDSSGNSIRLYTKNDCVDSLNGNWYANGECLVRNGGSYSAICGLLNVSPPDTIKTTPDTCIRNYAPLGFPSFDKKKRLFSEYDCNAFYGTLSANGECTGKIYTEAECTFLKGNWSNNKCSYDNKSFSELCASLN